MPSVPKMPKDFILEKGVEFITEFGYSKLNITKLAEYIGSSTQPISWHFGNMERFRNELYDYALTKVRDFVTDKKSNSMESFVRDGEKYLIFAKEKPKLFRYLYMEGNGSIQMEVYQGRMNLKTDDFRVKFLSDLFKISLEAASRYIRNILIYCHGIASLIANDKIDLSKDEMIEMMDSAGESFLLAEGASKSDLENLRKMFKEQRSKR